MHLKVIERLVEVCKQQQVVIESLEAACEPCNKVNFEQLIDYAWVKSNLKEAEELLESEQVTL